MKMCALIGSCGLIPIPEISAATTYKKLVLLEKPQKGMRGEMDACRHGGTGTPSETPATHLQY